MSDAMKVETVDVPGGHLYAEREGSGPAVLFLHAAIADHRMWDREVREYAKDHTTVRFDVRGLGRSTPATAEYSEVDDIRRLLDHLHLGSATFVGCSNGGRLAIDFALEHPDRVENLLLVASGVSGFTEAHAPAAKDDFARDGERLTPIFQAWKAGKHDEALAGLQEYWCSAQTGANVELVGRMMRENAEEIFTDRSAAHAKGISPPAADRLGTIEAPTTYIYGDREEATTKHFGRKITQDIPGAKLVHVPEADHLVNLSRPKEFDAALSDLLR